MQRLRHDFVKQHEQLPQVWQVDDYLVEMVTWRFYMAADWLGDTVSHLSVLDVTLLA